MPCKLWRALVPKSYLTSPPKWQSSLCYIQKCHKIHATRSQRKCQSWSSNNNNLETIKKQLKNNLPPNFKLSPAALIPHKSCTFRGLLDLSFTLPQSKVHVTKFPSVNNSTIKLAPQQSMANMGIIQWYGFQLQSHTTLHVLQARHQRWLSKNLCW